VREGPNEGGEKRDSKKEKTEAKREVGMDEMNGRKKENQSIEQNIQGSGWKSKLMI
jgi:hypothetical protein